MFDPKFITLMRARTAQHAQLQGQPTMLGGLRSRKHPLSSMTYRPDSLVTGRYPSDYEGGSLKSFGKLLSKGARYLVKEATPVVQDVARQVKPIVVGAAKKFATDQWGKAIATYGPQVAEGVAMMAAGRPHRARYSRQIGGEYGGARRSKSLDHFGMDIETHGEHEPKPKRKRRATDLQMRRSKVVKEVMQQYGFTLPQASSYIKLNGIPY